MAERPKRPLSAYMIWLNEHREVIKKENPGAKVTDVAKRGGEMWRGLTDKTKWEKKAGEMKEQYTKDIKEFEANGGSTDAPSGKKRKSGGGGKAAPKAAPKKTKKKASSEEESEEDGSD